MNISQWQHYLLQEMEEDLSAKQKKIASLSDPKDKIDGDDFKVLRSRTTESEDHEVSMANNSLDSIIKDAMELKVKLGDNEKDIPAWIQDHITNAANFISQASENYHEYGEEDENMTSTPQGFNEGVEDVINDKLLVLKRVLTQLKTIIQKGNKLVDKEKVVDMIDMVLKTLGQIESYKA